LQAKNIYTVFCRLTSVGAGEKAIDNYNGRSSSQKRVSKRSRREEEKKKGEAAAAGRRKAQKTRPDDCVRSAVAQDW
jgi:hypothetical protein